MESKILSSLQKGIPLEPSPFQKLASSLGLSESQFLEKVQYLKDQKILRQISPIYDTKMVGYQSALVAFELEPEKIEKGAEIINDHPGVSHNYERNHIFNLWFTLAVPPDSSLGLEKTVELLAQKTKAKDFLILPSLKVFKIQVRFQLEGGPAKEKITPKKKKEYVPLSDIEKKVIEISQQDLPLVSRPFAVYGQDIGMTEAEVLGFLKSFLEKGVMRRFAGILNHRRAGYKANGMGVWKVAQNRIEEVGYQLAAFRAVSHCYERPVFPRWPYNLFSMIHGKTKEEVESLAKKMSEEVGISDYFLLFSSREFKKIRLQYFV
ncbi:MAG: Lrp/AsnC family transcriptional regulator, partial [Planctomycetota bacterium]